MKGVKDKINHYEKIIQSNTDNSTRCGLHSNSVDRETTDICIRDTQVAMNSDPPSYEKSLVDYELTSSSEGEDETSYNPFYRYTHEKGLASDHFNISEEFFADQSEDDASSSLDLQDNTYEEEALVSSMKTLQIRGVKKNEIISISNNLGNPIQRVGRFSKNDCTLLDGNSLYDLPFEVLKRLHEFLVVFYEDGNNIPMFSTISDDGYSIKSEPLFSKMSVKNHLFKFDKIYSEIYFARVVFILVRDYPSLESNKKTLGLLKEISKFMFMRLSVVLIKDTFNFYKVYLKSMNHFFSGEKRKSAIILHDAFYIDVLIERKTKGKYMLVPYASDAYGNKGKNRLVFVFIKGRVIKQKVIASIVSNKSKDGIVQLKADWDEFLQESLVGFSKNDTLVYSQYQENLSIYEYRLERDYGDKVDLFRLGSGDFGCSPIHHITEIKENVMEYDIDRMYDEAKSFCNGRDIDLPSLLATRISTKQRHFD